MPDYVTDDAERIARLEEEIDMVEKAVSRIAEDVAEKVSAELKEKS